MVMYDYDSNAILVEPMNNISTTEIMGRFTITHKRFYRAGLTPFYQNLDNEAPVAFKDCIIKLDINSSFKHILSKLIN